MPNASNSSDHTNGCIGIAAGSALQIPQQLGYKVLRAQSYSSFISGRQNKFSFFVGCKAYICIDFGPKNQFFQNKSGKT